MVKKYKPDEDGPRTGFPAIVDTPSLISVTGVSETRLYQLIRDGRIPMDVKAGHGEWHTVAALTAIFAYYRRQGDRAKSNGDKNIESQIELEDLRSKRLKNAKLSRELLPRRVYVDAWGELLMVFKNRLLNFGHKMGPRAFRAVDKVEASEILDKEMREILSGLSDPSVMEGIERAIRDDEFSTNVESSDESADEAGKAPGDLVSQDT